MTPLQIETAVKTRYNAVGDSYFPTDMVMDAIYQASMQLALEANVIEQTYSTTSTSGTNEYSFPTTAIAIKKVEYNGKKLFPCSLDDDPKTSTTEVTGTPTHYAIWGKELVLFPTPDTSSLTIKVFTYNMPSAVSSTSTLEVPSEYHLAMIDFVLSLFYAKDQNTQMADYHRGLWERSVQRIKRTQAKQKVGDRYFVVRDEYDLSILPGVIA